MLDYEFARLLAVRLGDNLLNFTARCLRFRVSRMPVFGVIDSASTEENV